MFFEKRKSKRILTLNIVSMIDICSLILIFLVMEAFFGESSIVIPSGMHIPMSESKEQVDNAPQVLISNDSVDATFLHTTVPLNLFHDGTEDQLKDFKDKVKSFVNQMKPEDRTSGVLLNIVADQKTPYRDIFDVVAVFRDAGFQSVLFIAQANK